MSASDQGGVLTTEVCAKRPCRDSASFERRQEYIVAAELLKQEFDVYITLVDDQGIDCVVRLDEHRYVDIQIKGRSERAKNWCRFAAMTFKARDNLYFIFALEKTQRIWVIPSNRLVELGRQNKTGKNAGCWTVDLPKQHTGRRNDRFAAFEGDAGFGLLRKHRLGG